MCHRESKRTCLQLEELALCDATLIILAERELAAFTKAVTELFGPEQASLSVADWIEELECLNVPARPTVSDIRQTTTAASARLAHRRLFEHRMRPDGA
jgi:hypothetical protein